MDEQPVKLDYNPKQYLVLNYNIDVYVHDNQLEELLNILHTIEGLSCTLEHQGIMKRSLHISIDITGNQKEMDNDTILSLGALIGQILALK